MNKAYRLIWSRVKEAWVVVSGNVVTKGGPRAVTVTLSAALILAAGSASALPTGSQVISGTAGIVTSGSSMTVTNSAGAIINWQAFSIANGETTRFIQPSALSAVLNRITGGDPSKILGTLQSNGKVLLINPSGIIFGPGSRVDVNGLIASTLDITNQDFLAGKMKFTAGAATGKVENQGTITTPSGGTVYLIARDVQNSGVITAPNGDVLLAAGKEVLLVDSANPEIAMVVSAPEGESINLGTIVADAGRIGMYGSVVRQQGRISADSAVQDASGRIFFKATKEATLEAGSVTTANGPQGGSVTVQASEGTTLVSGTVEANGSEGKGGSLDFSGVAVSLGATVAADGTAQGGTIAVSAQAVSLTDRVSATGGSGQGGTIDIESDTIALHNVYSTLDVSGASGGTIREVAGNQITSSATYIATGTGGDGGHIDLSAPATKLLSAQIDASGTTGGGQIRVGGEYQGGKGLATDELPNAETLAISNGSVIKADATELGNGGTVILWSDLESALYPAVTAKGKNGGTGGFIELSSAEKLSWGGSADAGLGGQVLMDPKNIVIQDATAGSVQYNLVLGYNYLDLPRMVGNNLELGDAFGSSVSLYGTQLAVGARDDGGSGNVASSSGALYLFNTPFSTPTLSGVIGKGYTGTGNFDVSALEPGDNFGASVSLSGTQLAVGAIMDSGSGNVASTSGAVYLFNTPFSIPSLSGVIGKGYSGTGNFDLSALEANDYFGSSVSFSGTQLVVGALGDGGSGNVAPYSGAAYLFNTPFGTPTLSGVIGRGYSGTGNYDVSALEAYDYFGYSVSLSDTQLAVGAYGDDGSGNVAPYSGVAYLFNTPFSTPSLSGVIGKGYTGTGNFDVSALEAGDYFGASVSLSDTQLAVGAIMDSGSGNVASTSGAVYLFNTPFSIPSLSGVIGKGYSGTGNFDLSALEANDRFGNSVSLSGTQLAVGAYGDDGFGNVAAQSGAVYLFNTPFSTPTLSGVIGKGYSGTGNFDVSALEAGDYFGASVSLSGTQLAVGADGDGGSGNVALNSGAVYLFNTPFSTPSLSGVIGKGYSGTGNFDVSALEMDDYFGSSVSLSDTQLAVGALGDGGSGNVAAGSGAVYLFNTPFSTPSLSGVIGKSYTGTGNFDLSALETSDYFGASVSLSGTQLAVGAYEEGGSGNVAAESGAVYLFNTPFTTPTLSGVIGKGYTGTGNFDLSALEAYDRFGSSVSLSGTQLAVGAYEDDGYGNGAAYSGAVYLFNTPFSTTTLYGIIGKGYTGTGNFDMSALEANDGFGTSVSLSGTQLAVGAYGDGGSGNVAGSSGAVYLFNTPFSTPSLSGVIGKGYTGTGNFDLSALEAGDSFGSSVSLSDTQLAVGATADDGSGNVAAESGAVYLFTLGSGSGDPAAGQIFSNNADTDSTITPASITAILNTGSALALQANNDITVNNAITTSAGGSGGNLTMQAGRSILLNANITTDNGNLNLTANEQAAAGVVDAYRDAGAAVITMAPGTAINAGSGTVTSNLKNGLGNTNNTSGNITVQNIVASSVTITNSGSTPGSGILLDGAINVNSGTLTLSSSTGSINQTEMAPITAATLTTSSAGGTTLTNFSNAITSFSATNTDSGDITLTNTAALLTVNGSNISQSGGGDVIINNTGAINTVGWIQTTGNGNISLTATDGTATIGNSLIAGDAAGTGAVSVTATGTTSDVLLNNINVYSGATGGGSGTITLDAAHDIQLNTAAIKTTGDTFLLAVNDVLLNGPVTSGSVGINGIAGKISGTGTITSSSISLLNAGGSGAIGISGSPLLTSSPGGIGNTDIAIGSDGSPSAVYLAHTGAATLTGQVYLAVDAPFSVQSSGNLTVPAIDTGTASLTLKSTGGALVTTGDLSGNAIDLTASGDFSPAGNVSATTNLTIDLTGAGSKFTRTANINVGGTTSTTIKADRIDNSATGSLGVAGSTVTLLPKTGGRDITLGTSTGDTGSDLELSTNDLSNVVASILRIGDNQSGAINIGAAIAFPSVTTLSLDSGNTVSQAAEGTISIANLGVKSLGSADLTTAANMVSGNIAAGLGDATHLNSDFKFKNSDAINVGTVDGISGIAMYMDGVYDSATPNGVISLTSTSGAITQSAASLLAGKAVQASGTSVTLTESNPTGVISGLATAGDFSYKSTNGIAISTIDGAAGITNTVGAAYINLTSDQGISQNAGAPIIASGSILNLTANAPVILTEPTNAASGSMSATLTGSGSLNFINSTGVNLGQITTSNQPVTITTSAGDLSATGNISAGTSYVALKTPGNISITGGGTPLSVSGQAVKLEAADFSMSYGGYGASVDATDIGIAADTFTKSGAVALNATNSISIQTLTNGREIAVGTGATGAGLVLDDVSTTFFNTPKLRIGNENTSGTYGAFSGNITVGGTGITRPSLLELTTNGTISQSANAPVIVNSLGLISGTAKDVILTESTNNVPTLAAKSGGLFSFTDAASLSLISMTTGSPAAAVNGVTATGATIITTTGSIVDGVTTVPAITAPNVSLTTQTGIGSSATHVKTQASNLSASSSTSGGIYIINSVPLTLQAASANGDIVVTNTGEVIAATLEGGVTSSTGSVSITAHSPLTIDTYGVSAATGVNLTAGSAGSSSSSDLLTINGPVTTTTGTILLAANSVSGSSVPSGANVTVSTYTPPPPPDPTPVPPTIGECTANPSLGGCSAVLPSIETCTATPSAPGCSVVLPSLSTCTSAPTTPGCSVVLPTIATCTSDPTIPGCSVVLPSLATCTATPTIPGCSVVLPTIATCTSDPTIPGCSVVLPSLSACITVPTLPGCSVVLPTILTCTSTPTIPGCTAVLPSIATCTATPSVPGCTVVLPSLASCIASPSAPGCSVVLPSLATCTATPTIPGCSVVLPTIATCTSAPTIPGCSVVLPSLAICAVAPTTQGCSVVLPTIATCTITPAIQGCSVVLPNLSTCITAPTLPGCSVVLPTLVTCTSTPTIPGCSVVLPSIATCTATPSVPGCTVVLPSLASCIASPSAPGCLVVLPSIATCSSNPASPGCSVVLPSLATCIASPGTVGCGAVLPGMISCIAAPSTPGCAVVLPTLADCAATPSAPGCVAVVPVAENRFLAPVTGQVINSLEQVPTTPVAPAGLQLIAQTPAASDSPTSQAGGGNNSDDKDKDKNKENSGQQPAGGDKKDDTPKKKYCN